MKQIVMVLAAMVAIILTTPADAQVGKKSANAFLQQHKVELLFSARLFAQGHSGPRLEKNPFAYENMVVAFPSKLRQVLDRDVGHFMGPQQGSDIGLIIEGMPTNMTESYSVMVVRVLGNTKEYGVPLPRAEYIAHIPCQYQFCSDYKEFSN